MDPREYDRIADLLMQIRSKIDNINTKHRTGKNGKDSMLHHIEMALKYNDSLAQFDGKGWL